MSSGTCIYTEIKIGTWKSPGEQVKNAAVAFNNHKERRRPFLAGGLSSSVLHGPFAMEEGSPTRRDGRRRVVW